MESKLANLITMFAAASGALALFWLVALGPAVRWAPRASYGTLRVVYAPLLWAREIDNLRGPVEWYVEKWERD